MFVWGRRLYNLPSLHVSAKVVDLVQKIYQSLSEGTACKLLPDSLPPSEAHSRQGINMESAMGTPAQAGVQEFSARKTNQSPWHTAHGICKCRGLHAGAFSQVVVTLTGCGSAYRLPKISDLKKNDTLTLEDITLLKTENNVITIGTPIIKDAKVKAKVIDHIRDNKIIVFKKKRRHNYRRKIGHRQDLTLVKIEEIITSSSSNKKPKEENQPKKEVSDGS